LEGDGYSSLPTMYASGKTEESHEKVSGKPVARLRFQFPNASLYRVIATRNFSVRNIVLAYRAES
jgi:hypothetical protein